MSERDDIPAKPSSPTGGSRPSTGFSVDPSSQMDSASKALGLDQKLEGPKAWSTSSIALPKGGGALKSIAEKFRANPVTGTGAFTIPIGATHARGLEPSLALSYDSGSGNGPYGMGWSVGLGSVRRKTDKGLPRYRDDLDSDIFVLSDAEDLVPARRQNTTTSIWEPDTQTRTESGVDYVVRRYRPRLEGAFARIERWTNSTGDAHWRVRDRNNVLRIYGKSATARVADPAMDSRVFEWLLEEIRDDRGNRMKVTYAQDDASRGAMDGVENVARSRGWSPFTQTYPVLVSYGNKTPDAEDWIFALAFDWSQMTQDDLDIEGGSTTRLSPVCLRDVDLGGQVLRGQVVSSSGVASGGTEPTIRSDPFSNRRAGFDVRTRWRCRRIVQFHGMTFGAGGATLAALPASHDESFRWVPVRAWELLHDDAAHVSKLTSVTSVGYRTTGTSTAALTTVALAMPAVTFGYQNAVIGTTVATIAKKDADLLPTGIDGRLFRWQDLDGEGLTGILTEQGGAWWYQRNLGNPARWPPSDDPTRVFSRPQFGPLTRVTPSPVIASFDAGAQLVDLDGDGRAEVMVRTPGLAGTHTRTATGGWTAFRPFRRLPNIDWNDPALRFVDLTGDGRADLLITENDVLRWHPSEALDGYGPEERIRLLLDEARAPKVVFGSETEAVFLADMTGDGLQDLVRVRCSSICYWPNLGYGRFGAKVEMRHAPLLDRPSQFNPSRVRLTDVDGTGTADILYAGRQGVVLAFNASGNEFVDAGKLPVFLPVDDETTVDTVDVLADGTSCLVWSSPLPGDRAAPIRYVRLMAEGKPHLLCHVDNGQGGVTDLQYAPSTQFYVRDRDAGRSWATKLPFPVHCLERVEVRDLVREHRMVQRYAYHHGYFDGVEREFRGFGMVEQFDTEAFFEVTPSSVPFDPTAEANDTYAAPSVTKTWFHTGAWFEASTLLDAYRAEWFKADTDAPVLFDPVFPTDLTAAETREAYRALKGQALRVEVWAHDPAATVPYSVATTACEVRAVQPRNGDAFASFHTVARESVQIAYEAIARATTAPHFDPRITQSLVLEIDAFGTPVRTASFAYPRRGTPTQTEQQRAWGVLNQLHVKHDTSDDDRYRLGVPLSQRRFEIGGGWEQTPWPTAGAMVNGDVLLRSAVADAATALLGAPPTSSSETILRPHETLAVLKPDVGASGFEMELRLVGHQAMLYATDELTGVLSYGSVGARALVQQVFTLACTNEVLDGALAAAAGWDNPTTGAAARVSDLAEGGYVDLHATASTVPHTVVGDAWIPSAVPTYDDAHFYVVTDQVDPFGTTTTITWADHRLFPTSVQADLTSTLHHTVSSVVDAHTLQPASATDINGNVTKAKFDALGRVTKVATVGNPSLTGIDLDDLDDYPTVVFTHTFGALSGGAFVPAYVHTWSRVEHSGLTGPIGRGHLDDVSLGTIDAMETVVWADGLGRPVMTKTKSVDDTDSATWIGSGRVILNEKGQPVKQYEPFFSSSEAWQDDGAVRTGSHTKLRYDPLGRLIQTMMFDGTFATVAWTPWSETHADPIDTLTSGSAWFASGHAGHALTTGEKNHLLDDLASTPTLVHVDPLGRPFLERRMIKAATSTDAAVTTDVRVVLDVQGRGVEIHAEFVLVGEVEVRDGLVDQLATTDVFDLAGRSLVHTRRDAQHMEDIGGTPTVVGGVTRSLPAIDGQPVRAWSRKATGVVEGRGSTQRMTYDAFRRPLGLYVTDTTVSSPAAELNVLTRWGEHRPDDAGESDTARKRNLVGKPWQVYDPAGMAETVALDHAGRPLETARTFAEMVTAPPDWTPVATGFGAPPSLLTETFTSTAEYDSLGRVTASTTPDGTREERTYDTGGRLRAVATFVRGSSSATPVLHAQLYNARGQRTQAQLGDDGTSGHGPAMTKNWTYDPDTFRVTQIQTMRTSDSVVLQDLRYRLDPVGNVLSIDDLAQEDIYFGGTVAVTERTFSYDALYRLHEATGREHPDTSSDLPGEAGQFGARAFSAGDHAVMRAYTETFTYDPVGNLLSKAHFADSVTMTRRYAYARDAGGDRFCNQLIATSRPGDTDADTELTNWTDRGVDDGYVHDAHGNMTQIPGVLHPVWDRFDRLARVDAGGDVETDGYWHYVYDASGQRVRKVRATLDTDGTVAAVWTERIYVGGWERCQAFDSSSDVTDETETRHVMDDRSRVATIEHVSMEASVAISRTVWRYQLDDHLGTACVEVTEAGEVISYEEFHPYGTTAFRAQDPAHQVSLKRYRFTAMERDEETGMQYHSARYYAPWLGRWTAADPAGVQDGLHAYAYCRGNPVRGRDQSGLGTTCTTGGGSWSQACPDGPATPTPHDYWADVQARGPPAPVATPKRSPGPGTSSTTATEPVTPANPPASVRAQIAPQRRTGIEDGVFHPVLVAPTPSLVDLWLRPQVEASLSASMASESPEAKPPRTTNELVAAVLRMPSASTMVNLATAVKVDPKSKVDVFIAVLPGLADSKIAKLGAGAVSTDAKAVVGGLAPVRQGAAGVERAIADLEAAGGSVVGREITIEAGGLRTRPDLYVRLPDGQHVFIEVKTGASARLTRNQAAAFPQIWAQGGIPRGANAASAGFTPGVPIPPTPVWTVHYPWPLP